jgi:allophanate hydrolase
MSIPDVLTLAALEAGYRDGTLSPDRVMEAVLARIDAAPERNAWITRLSREQVGVFVRRLEGQSPATLPLYGVPFAIKDNIDLAGVPTTAGCPEFAYTPGDSAVVVAKLVAAGAIPVGKTNLDQFATGLVGTRSPYGACRNSLDPDYVSGGSSSGSAVAVASGLVSFSLGTDTAGSGRVPAAFNNLIGLKPTCGWLSTHGVVPACRSLDAVSIFALTAADAAKVLDVARGHDAHDAYSRPDQSVRGVSFPSAPLSFRFGVPEPRQLEFFGDAEYARLFHEAVGRLEALGGIRVPVDMEPFLETARLLYEGPWVAERLAAIESFLRDKPDAVFPVTRGIISRGAEASAVDAFRAQYRLKALAAQAMRAWQDVDVMVTPTAGTIYRIAEVEADPVRLNSHLGFYTNFLNLLDLAAVAVPAGFRRDGMPFGITLVGMARSDHSLLALASRFHAAQAAPLGARLPLRSTAAADVPFPSSDRIAVAVCGAHLSGLPLNGQLTDRGAVLEAKTHTAACYRLYALPGGPPLRPGMIKVAEGGAAIEVEVWSMPVDRFGSFVAGIPAPLGIGKVLLADGRQVPGFVCEGVGMTGAHEITSFGGWRAYLASLGST